VPSQDQFVVAEQVEINIAATSTTSTTSIQVLRVRAESGDAEAMLQLAHKILEKKDSSPEERFDEAVVWLEKAAKLGNAEAQNEMADVSRAKEDWKNALSWDFKAARQDWPKSQYNLGVCFRDGIGTPVNLEKAFYWYRKAARNGVTEAKLSVAICCLHGHGTEQDFPQAIHWLQQASDDGNAEAKMRLGVAYIQGVGCPVDTQKGLSLLHQAAALGNPKAKELLISDEVMNITNNEDMTEEQRAALRRKPQPSVPIPSLDPSFRSRLTNIFDAAKEGTVKDVQFFVERNGVDVNARDEHKNTPIIYASGWNSNAKVLQYLISQGGKVNVKNCVGNTPLYFAVGNNSAEVVQILVSNGADVNARDCGGKRPMEHADKEEKRRILCEGGGTKNELVIMLVGGIIGAIFGGTIGIEAGVSGVFGGLLFGAYLGVGIGPSMADVKEELILFFKNTWIIFCSEIRKKGIGEALFGVFVVVPFIMVTWRIPKLGFKILINPFIAICRYCRIL